MTHQRPDRICVGIPFALDAKHTQDQENFLVGIMRTWQEQNPNKELILRVLSDDPNGHKLHVVHPRQLEFDCAPYLEQDEDATSDTVHRMWQKISAGITPTERENALDMLQSFWDIAKARLKFDAASPGASDQKAPLPKIEEVTEDAEGTEAPPLPDLDRPPISVLGFKGRDDAPASSSSSSSSSSS